MMMEAILMIAVILVTGLAGYKVKSLTNSGAIAAFITGLGVFSGFGVKGLLLLGTFFATSSMWSKFKSSYKSKIEEKLAKGARRDWLQVMANGGTAVLFSLMYYFDHNNIWLIGFAVSIASANSDTWASEIGSLSKHDPLFIRTFKRVDKGTSGAISLLGSTAAFGGSLLIAMMSFWLFSLSIGECLLILLFGYLGNVIDTLFGAFFQRAYVCPQCGVKTEKKQHCGHLTTKIKGLQFIDNDMVNFLSGFFASWLALLFI